MKFWFATFLFFFSACGLANAQSFDSSMGIGEEEVKKAAPVSVARPQEVFIPKNELPQVVRPTLDGSERGGIMMNAIVSENKQASTEEGQIFIYYKDFSVKRMLSGLVNCDLTFVVLTTLDRKISNISLKLKWPNLLTTLSYDDVNPNIETTFRYTLMGDGCYSLDKTPNIIVNRCRVKDMTQEQCASKIHWLKKS